MGLLDYSRGYPWGFVPAEFGQSDLRFVPGPQLPFAAMGSPSATPPLQGSAWTLAGALAPQSAGASSDPTPLLPFARLGDWSPSFGDTADNLASPSPGYVLPFAALGLDQLAARPLDGILDSISPGSDQDGQEDTANPDLVSAPPQINPADFALNLDASPSVATASLAGVTAPAVHPDDAVVSDDDGSPADNDRWSTAGHAALTAGAFVPGPLGSLSALGDAGLSLGEGDYTGAGLSALGALGGTVSDAGADIAALKAARKFLSYRAAKRFLGSAGQDLHWHHIVEQSQIGKFGSEAINSFDNMIALPKEMHQAISNYYSSAHSFTGGKPLREWLKDKSFEEQYAHGIDAIIKHLHLM